MKLHTILLILFFTATAGLAYGQSSAELKRQKEAIQREIQLLQKNLDKAARNKQATRQQINALNAQIRLRQEKIGVINSEIKNLDNQISENTNTVHNLQGQLGELKKDYAAMIRFAQRNRNAYDKMMFVFAAADFNQAYKRIKYLQQFGQYRKKQADYIQGTQKQLNGKIAELDRTRREKSTLLQDQEREREKLGKNKSEQSTVLNDYSKQERRFRQDIAQQKKKQAAIDRSLRAAIAREIEKAKREAEERERREAAAAKAANKPAPVASSKTKSTSDYLKATPEAARLSANFENNRGSLPSPVAVGTITERFGRHMVDKASIDNDGVTFTTGEGAAVRAVFQGQVSNVVNNMGRYFVLIKHGEYFTIYSNLASVSVSRGDKVETKQTIGTVGSSDGSGELQFQIRRVTVPLNPEAWLAR
ncbi:murein hydrolase activator EnvC [Pedobacter sp. SYP-B3415]|uniref:murein hydrolase activator EnvC family protein n=1 Tax=Pedobacter sp. SYP-B3415 TaxID=2496641 RepID=UPI00101D5D44|nr:peptidoglycan DD-metalloendopeptidase family protein [Pedobacter sp. SYP-B3415]